MRLVIVCLSWIISAPVSMISVSAQPSEPTDFQGWMNRGVASFKSASYQEAIDAFKRAESLKPDDPNVHLYLGTAYMQMYIPGAGAPENLTAARRAEVEFKRVLEIHASETTALASLRTLSFNQASAGPAYDEKIRKFDEARDWNARLLAIVPQDKEAHYWAGVIVWSEYYPALMVARANEHMMPPDPGPLPSTAARLELSSKYGQMIDDGMKHLRQAIEIDPQYADAMAYLNLLIRERADLRDTPEQYKQDIQEADSWVQHALDAKKQMARTAQSAPPPPPPPPPGSASQTPQRIRISGNVQQANLVRKVDPVCPALAAQERIQGVVKLAAVIAKDGTIQNLQVISGPPLLVPAALDTVKQWYYRPTLLNNLPVEVITQVEVNMPCGN